MATQRMGSPFLQDDITGDIVGIKDNDGSELYFASQGDLGNVAGIASFSQSQTYPDGSLGAHAKAYVSVTDDPYNAKSGGPSATAAFQAAYDATPAGGRIIVPGPGPYTLGSVTGTKHVVWEVQYDMNTNLALLNLPGSVAGVLGSADANYRGQGLGTQFALKRLNRLANYVGGTPGTVCSNLNVQTTVSSGADSFEWVGTFILDNSGSGQNVALYGQGNRRAVSAFTAGGTFAGVCEARDFTEEKDPTTGLIGLEVDVFANDTDANGRRVGIDMVVGKGVSAGLKCEAFVGLRVGPVLGDATRGRFRNAILINGDKDYAMRVTGVGVENAIDITSTGGKIGVRVGGTNSDADFVSDGTANIGMRLSGTYASGLAMRIKTGDAIGLESTGVIKVNYSSPNIQFMNGAAVRNSFNTSTGAISVGANQVVGPRVTGWNAPTGTVARGTFDVATATVATCAAAIAAMITDNRAHGLYGT